MAEREHLIGIRRASPGYDQDYAAWIEAQLALMKAGRWQDLDAEHLIDEVGDLGRSEFSAFASAIEVVIVHMLKWDVQPGRRTPGWVASIVEHRRRAARSLKDNPSYKARIDEAVERAFDAGSARAAAETDLPLTAFPNENPYDWAAIMTREHGLPGRGMDGDR